MQGTSLTEGIGVIALAIGALVWMVRRNRIVDAKNKRREEGRPEAHCLTCGAEFFTPMGAWRGNTGIEVVLYVAGLVPGLVYSIWRRGGTPQHQCPACGSRHTVPYESPAAAANRRKLGLGAVEA